MGLGINEINGDDLNTKCLNKGERGNRAGCMVVISGVGVAWVSSVHEVVESRENLCGLECGYIDETAPDCTTGETACYEAGDDAKVVRTAFEGTPKVGVG